MIETAIMVVMFELKDFIRVYLTVCDDGEGGGARTAVIKSLTKVTSQPHFTKSICDIALSLSLSPSLFLSLSYLKHLIDK